VSDYRKLIVWQHAHGLVLTVYQATTAFPEEEMYGLTTQTRRAANSVPANIAEGTGRGTQAELARFCRIACGSLNELEYHLLLARHLGYLCGESHKALEEKIVALRRLLTKFIQSLQMKSK
jgi:four helix bundle protein